jgi:hypothetical protein
MAANDMVEWPDGSASPRRALRRYHFMDIDENMFYLDVDNGLSRETRWRRTTTWESASIRGRGQPLRTSRAPPRSAARIAMGRKVIFLPAEIINPYLIL